jgi:hypothetical protein
MKRIDKLFLQFAAFYGQVWRSQFKQDGFILFMKKEWHEALLPYEDRVVELAINTCRSSNQLPPTLPQFIEICKSIRRRDVFIKAVPTTKSTISEVAAKNLLQIKQILCGTTTLS